MSSGHGGASGRFESLKDDAFEYAFLLKLENKTEVELQKTKNDRTGTMEESRCFFPEEL